MTTESFALFGFGKKKKAKKEVVKIICPYGAGGTADAIARKFGKVATELYPEYEFVVENKTGGDGFTATAYYQNVDPKKMEFMLLGYGNATRHELGKKYGTEPVPYDLSRMKPIGAVDDRTWLVYVKPGTTVQDLIAKAKAGTLKMSGGSPLSDPHLTLGTFMAIEGGKVRVVPYEGGAQQKQGLLSGEVDVFVGSSQAGKSEVEVGTLEPLFAFSADGYIGFPGIKVPGLVNNRPEGLSKTTDYTPSILPGGGFIAGRAGMPEETNKKMQEVIKAVWNAPEFHEWIVEIGLNRAEAYGDDAQDQLMSVVDKSVKAFEMLSGKN
jgi:tripartite-type tricarboxylate transporter receptor subunit TctC